tara:strand:- start:479 stop:895 length:417 start_codon:yes stop_codon:yes gene_type:complete
MKTILLKILPYDIVEYIYYIYLNEYIEYKLVGKMFHLENVATSFIAKFNSEMPDSIYLNDYIIVNNLLVTSSSIFKNYIIIKNNIIKTNLRIFFTDLTKLLIKCNEIIKIHSKNEEHLHIANYGKTFSRTLDKIIDTF